MLPTDFLANSAKLAEEDKGVIDELAEYIYKAYNEAQSAESMVNHEFQVRVEGHADTGRRPEPKPPPLKDLCQARADAVKAQLIAKFQDLQEKHGRVAVPTACITARGVGAVGVNPWGVDVKENYNKRVYFYCTAEPVSPPGPVEPDASYSEKLEQHKQAYEEELSRQKQIHEHEIAALLEEKAGQQPDPRPSKPNPPPPDGCCVLFILPKAGASMAVLHGLAELVWIAAMVVCGKSVFAALLTGASLESADTCPEAEVRRSYSPADTPSPSYDGNRCCCCIGVRSNNGYSLYWQCRAVAFGARRYHSVAVGSRFLQTL